MLRLLKPNEEAMLRMILHALNQFPLEWGCVHRSREPMMDSFPPQPKDCDVCVRAIFLGATKRIVYARARAKFWVAASGSGRSALRKILHIFDGQRNALRYLLHILDGRRNGVTFRLAVIWSQFRALRYV